VAKPPFSSINAFVIRVHLRFKFLTKRFGWLGDKAIECFFGTNHTGSRTLVHDIEEGDQTTFMEFEVTVEWDSRVSKDPFPLISIYKACVESSTPPQRR